MTTAPVQPRRSSLGAHAADAAILAAKATMAHENACFLPPPAVHMIGDQHSTPYRGYISCRPFKRGRDAIDALTGLTQLAALLNADRLVFFWEHADLLTALIEPRPDYPNALVTAEVTLTEHTLTWRPFTIELGPPNPKTGLPTGTPTWGPEAILQSASLPTGIGASVHVWRATRHDGQSDVDLVWRELELQGYRAFMAA